MRPFGIVIHRKLLGAWFPLRLQPHLLPLGEVRQEDPTEQEADAQRSPLSREEGHDATETEEDCRQEADGACESRAHWRARDSPRAVRVLCDSVAPGPHIAIRPRTPVGRARRSNRHRRPSSISGMDIDHPRFSAYVLPTRAGHIRCLRWSTPRWQSTSHSPSSCPYRPLP